MRNRIKNILPRNFLVRLTIVNVAFISLFTFITGTAIYHTACFLVEGINTVQTTAQQNFKQTLFQYLWLFSFITVLVGSIVHYFATKQLIDPVRQMIHSTQQLKKGKYLKVHKKGSRDEMGQLVSHFNSLTDQLEQNEKHRHKVLSDMAHEFRTPLSNLNGYLVGLQNGVIKGDTELYQSLLHESQRLTNMVQQLEQLKEWDLLTHQPVMQKEQASITELVQNGLAAFEWSLNESNIAVQTDIQEATLPLHVSGIQQVLSNLLNNAIQYYQGEEDIHIQGKVIDQHYRVSIIGEGQPISKTDQEKIFSRFYRTDPSRSRSTGGTGLGLAISKEIVEQHNGRIWLESDEFIHSFHFEIPISDYF